MLAAPRGGGKPWRKAELRATEAPAEANEAPPVVSAVLGIDLPSSTSTWWFSTRTNATDWTRIHLGAG
jgi:hypothetical protein